MSFDEQAEYEALTNEQKRMVEQVIEDCRNHGAMANIWESEDHAYAYPHRSGGIAWGINGGLHGWCIARGIRRTERERDQLINDHLTDADGDAND